MLFKTKFLIILKNTYIKRSIHGGKKVNSKNCHYKKEPCIRSSCNVHLAEYPSYITDATVLNNFACQPVRTDFTLSNFTILNDYRNMQIKYFCTVCVSVLTRDAC